MAVAGEYQKRAYCKAIKCPVQAELDASAEGAPAYEAARDVCKTACLRSAEHFRGWLAGAGFSIVGSAGPASESALAAVAKKEPTAWRFHHAVEAQGLRVVR